MTFSSPSTRQRELLAFIGNGGTFVRLAPGKPWQLVDDSGRRRSSWISDDGLFALYVAGWIDSGGALGNQVEFAPALSDEGRDVLGEARDVSIPAAPATAAAIDADIERRRGVGLTNRAISETIGCRPSRVLKVLDDRIPDARSPCGRIQRDIDAARVDREPPAPVPAKVSPSERADDKWGGDELDYLTARVKEAVAEHGNRRGQPLYLPYKALSRRFARTETSVAGKVRHIRGLLREKDPRVAHRPSPDGKGSSS